MCMYVGAMEGVGGRGDSFSENMGTTQSAFGDELDIVGEDTFDDSANEGHLGVLHHLYIFVPL